MDFHINWENNFLSMITPVHVFSDHFKTSVQGGWGLYLVWNGAAADTNTTRISRCTSAVMSQGAYDIIGANISGFDCDDSAEQRQKPMKSPEMLVIL